MYLIREISQLQKDKYHVVLFTKAIRTDKLIEKDVEGDGEGWERERVESWCLRAAVFAIGKKQGSGGGWQSLSKVSVLHASELHTWNGQHRDL